MKLSERIQEWVESCKCGVWLARTITQPDLRVALSESLVMQARIAELEAVQEMAGTIRDGIAIAAYLSKDMRNGESAVQWVKRVIRERDEAAQK